MKTSIATPNNISDRLRCTMNKRSGDTKCANELSFSAREPRTFKVAKMLYAVTVE